MWTLPPLYASELCLFAESGVQHVRFAVESFTALSVSSWFLSLTADSSFWCPLLFDVPLLKLQLGIWSLCSGTEERHFSAHLKTSHLVLCPNSELPKPADFWLLSGPSCLWLGYLFSSSSKVWWSASSSETSPFFLSSDFIRESSNGLVPGSSDLM